MKNIFRFLFIASFFVFAACEESLVQDENKELLVEEEEDFVANPPRTDLLRIRDDERALMATIQVEDTQNTKITFGEAGLFGKVKSPENKRYTDHTDFALIEVKSVHSGSFELQTSDGRLLWQVKLRSDKVKISHQEDGSDAYELQKFEDNAIKIIYKEQELGTAQVDKKNNQVQLLHKEEEIFSVESSQNSYAFVLMLANEIPLEEKYILMAELLARGL